MSIWFMRDNHTFLKLPRDFATAKQMLSDDWDNNVNAPYGMVGLKGSDEESLGYRSVLAKGNWQEFIKGVEELYNLLPKVNMKES